MWFLHPIPWAQGSFFCPWGSSRPPSGLELCSTALGQPGSALGAKKGPVPSGWGVEMLQFCFYFCYTRTTLFICGAVWNNMAKLLLQWLTSNMMVAVAASAAWKLIRMWRSLQYNLYVLYMAYVVKYLAHLHSVPQKRQCCQANYGGRGITSGKIQE